jgi:carboxymethylenebutenolidase
MSKHEMLDTFKKHVDAELAGDLETTMATMTADPHLHNVPSMVGRRRPRRRAQFLQKPFSR